MAGSIPVIDLRIWPLLAVAGRTVQSAARQPEFQWPQELDARRQEHDESHLDASAAFDGCCGEGPVAWLCDPSGIQRALALRSEIRRAGDSTELQAPLHGPTPSRGCVVSPSG